jgi:hypothetical protein
MDDQPLAAPKSPPKLQVTVRWRACRWSEAEEARLARVLVGALFDDASTVRQK